jgi:hypothetical protein
VYIGIVLAVGPVFTANPEVVIDPVVTVGTIATGFAANPEVLI